MPLSSQNFDQEFRPKNPRRRANDGTLNNFTIFFSFVKRELFICDAEDIQREIVTQNQMRFHCKILYYKSLEEAVEKFDETEEDTFFYILGFNPQKRVIVCQERM